MNIEIHRLADGAKNAKGIVVVIDVLRACTTICILLKQGVSEIVPVKTPEEAVTFKSKGYLLIGEGKHGHIHEVFNYNNSPSEILNKDFTGKKVVLRSNNATQAILNAQEASDIVLASFLNIDSIVNYIQNHKLKDVALIALGSVRGNGIEDELCAEMIKNKLEGKNYNFNKIKSTINNCETAILVRETLKRPKDVDIALQLNTYNVVPRITTEGDHKVIRVF